MSTLAILVALICIMTVVESACYRYRAKLNGGTNCELEGVPIPNGTTKKVGCKRCSCFGRGEMACCDIGGYMIVPDTCIVQYNGCFPKAVLRSDPRRPCDGPVSMIG